MPLEDSRTYITDRVNAMVLDLKRKYRIDILNVKTYHGLKFEQCMVFEHEDGFFKIIDWSDRSHRDKMESADIINDEKCQFVLKCQYDPSQRCGKLRPYYYFEKTKPQQFSNRLIELRSIEKTKHLHWRGNLHLGRRAILENLSDLLNDDYPERIDVASYYQELSQHQLAISLPGLGKSCHREFECFAIGTVVVSPPFQNIYHTPLIPDVHYVAVEPETMRDRIQSITDDEIAFIRTNAMNYYDSLIRFESSVKLLPHLLEL